MEVNKGMDKDPKLIKIGKGTSEKERNNLINLIKEFFSLVMMNLKPIVGCDGETRVYYNQPTTPLAHWPFRRQTAKRPEVSREVILMGWPKTQVSWTRFCCILYVGLVALPSPLGLSP